MTTAKEFKEQLLEEYPIKIELHTHTNPVSSCAKIKPEELTKKYMDEGLDGVVITNHMNPDSLRMSKEEWCEFYMKDYLAAKAAAKDGFRVYLGMEIRFTENSNDYLVYGVDEAFIGSAYDYIDKGIEAFYKALKTDKNLIVQAHPFRDYMERNYTEKLDGIEVFNLHRGHNSRVGVAARFAKENPGVITGGSDVHYPQDTPVIFARFKELPRNSFDIAANLKRGDYLLQVGSTVILP